MINGNLKAPAISAGAWVNFILRNPWVNCIKKDDLVTVYKDQYGNFCIKHNGRLIGRLSKNSTIAQRANKDNVNELSDFYISSVFIWTYEDTIKHDGIHGTDFAKMWSKDAKEQGYINLVQIAGFGSPTK